MSARVRASRWVGVLAVCFAALPGSALAEGPTDFEWPATGFVSQTVDEHVAFEGQEAVDIANAAAGPIVAAYDGVVQASFNHVPGGVCTVDGKTYPKGYGQVVVLRHDGGSRTYWTMYGHLATGSRLVDAGQRVRQGDRLGTMGSTGCSSGTHVHFQIGNCANTGSGGNGLIPPSCAVWNPPEPGPGTNKTRGTAVGSSYTGLAWPLFHWAGQIVQWNGDTKPQRTSWLVGNYDLKRRWVPNVRTYNCLRARGVADAGARPAATLDRLTDVSNVWAQCPFGDVDYNGKVNLFDLSRLLTAYGQGGPVPADVNYDSAVNIFDLSILLTYYGSTS
jgi:murein DD-endopeptidase MepM/ murein hydrolase activator NlpD